MQATFNVTFSPTEAKTYSDNLTVNSNATSGASSMTITGSGKASIIGTRIISLPSRIDFGSVKVGESKDLSLSIANSGKEPLVITSISLPTGFTSTYSGTIQPNQTIYTNITFRTTLAINYSGSLKVVSNATAGNPSILITGTGTSNSTHQILVIPALNTFAPCETGTIPCSFDISYGKGMITAKVESVNTSTKQITVVFKKSSGSTFNQGGNSKVVSNLCPTVGQPASQYRLASFSQGASAVSVTFTEPDMTGTKEYFIYTIQPVSAGYVY